MSAPVVNKVGRPTLLDEDMKERLLQLVRLGMSLNAAARLAGVSAATAYEWVQRGEGRDDRSPEPVYVEFAEAFRKAEAEGEAVRLARIAEAAKGGKVVGERVRRRLDPTTGAVVEEIIDRRLSEPQWVADAWWLERRYPERWGRPYRLEARAAIEEIEEKRIDGAEVRSTVRRILVGLGVAGGDTAGAVEGTAGGGAGGVAGGTSAPAAGDA